MRFCEIYSIDSCNKPFHLTAECTSTCWRKISLRLLSNNSAIRIALCFQSYIVLKMSVWRPLKISQVNLQ